MMAYKPVDFTKTRKSIRIQENLIGYIRLFAGLPGIDIHDADSFWIVSNKGAPGNAIFRSGMSADQVEQQIDELFVDIGQYIDQIDWMVFPYDEPPDLSTRLEARGIPGGRGGNWLWADLTSPCVVPVMPPDFRIEKVNNNERMAEWVRVSEKGFGQELDSFYPAYARHGYGADAFSVHFTGYLANIPVTSGTLFDCGGSAAIYDVSTPPAFRRQGLGSAITSFLLQEIRNRGYNDTWIWSSDLAKSVYQGLGFVEADFGMREHTWHRF
jgi:GNAT superfamily N-acetyltransferase